MLPRAVALSQMQYCKACQRCHNRRRRRRRLFSHGNDEARLRSSLSHASDEGMHVRVFALECSRTLPDYQHVLLIQAGTCTITTITTIHKHTWSAGDAFPPARRPARQPASQPAAAAVHQAHPACTVGPAAPRPASWRLMAGQAGTSRPAAPRSLLPMALQGTLRPFGAQGLSQPGGTCPCPTSTSAAAWRPAHPCQRRRLRVRNGGEAGRAGWGMGFGASLLLMYEYGWGLGLGWVVGWVCARRHI